MRELIEPEEARQRIAENLPKIPAIDCPLEKCAGRILREEIIADRPFPPFDRSMMDGFALRAADAKRSATFQIVATATAGAKQVSNGTSANSCVEIMTGATLPADADCIVPYENTERIDETHIRLAEGLTVNRGDFIHRKGSDFDKGNSLLELGTTLGSREIAAAATCGCATLQVSKIPRIAIACSGDELVEVNETPNAHQIRRSNDTCIETGLASVHIHAAERTYLPDDPETTREGLKKLIAQNDFVILSGGISMGKKDFTPGLLDELGLHCHFHGVAQKPGKPMGYWTNNSCAVFALPGNPLSTLTCLHYYVITAIQRAMGLETSRPFMTVTLTASERVRKDLTVFLPVTLTKDNTAIPCPPQNSGDLARILQSDGFIAVPAGDTEAAQGMSYSFNPWH